MFKSSSGGNRDHFWTGIGLSGRGRGRRRDFLAGRTRSIRASAHVELRRPMSGSAGGSITHPQRAYAISLCRRFSFLVSRVAKYGTFNRARVHAKPSREFRQMIRIPGAPKGDRDEACLSETGG